MFITQRYASIGLLVAATSSVAWGQLTGSVGASVPFNNVQPVAAVRYYLQAYGVFGIGVPIRMFAFGYTPSSTWVPCDGRLLAIASNQALFAQIGTIYGGDGRVTFAVPDLRGRVEIGVGQGPGLSNYVEGQTLGSESSTLTTVNLPAHAHGTPLGMTGVTGGGLPYSNMQPTAAVRYSIARQGIFPQRDTGFGVGPADPYLGMVIMHAGQAVNANYLTAAEGQMVAISVNTALFSLAGTMYGGDGRQTFQLPDLRGRIPMDFGQGAGLSPRVQGEVTGTETQTITSATMALHRHGLGLGQATQYAGSGQPVSTMQPSLTITYGICVDGVYPASGMDDSYGYIGEYMMFVGSFVPGGYLPCDGRLMAIGGNEALYSLIGTTYGGDGQATFALPDLRGRVPVGDSAAFSLGSYTGSEAVTLTAANLAPHQHTLPCPADVNYDNVLDFNDYLDFVDAMATGGLAADFNHDGVVDFFDYLDFLQAFSGGC